MSPFLSLLTECSIFFLLEGVYPGHCDVITTEISSLCTEGTHLIFSEWMKKWIMLKSWFLNLIEWVALILSYGFIISRFSQEPREGWKESVVGRSWFDLLVHVWWHYFKAQKIITWQTLYSPLEIITLNISSSYLPQVFHFKHKTNRNKIEVSFCSTPWPITLYPSSKSSHSDGFDVNSSSLFFYAFTHK